LVALVAAVGCHSSSTSTSTSTSTPPTHDGGRAPGGVFAPCLSSADCRSDLYCACGGICTVSCTASPGACAALKVGADCPPGGIPVTDQCTPDNPGCVTTCTSDDACRMVGPTAVCRDGWCKVPASDTLVDGGVPTCDDQLAPLQARIEAAVAAADKSCTRDTDCVEVSASTRCTGSGCPDTFVTDRAGGDLQAALQALDDQYCDAILFSGCATTAGAHSCPLIAAAACVNGTCGSSLSP
jgi:hypothetical protein